MTARKWVELVADDRQNLAVLVHDLDATDRFAEITVPEMFLSHEVGGEILLGLYTETCRTRYKIRVKSALKPLNHASLKKASAVLASKHSELAFVYQKYGPPPLWDRPTGFATLLNIILEQQVSLASAKACFDKLAVHLGEITPERLLTTDDTTLKAIGFSRQKTAYARHLAETILSKRIDLDHVHTLPDHEVKVALIQLKGIGEWTADVYLLMAMLRPDVMPRGDIALHAAYQKLTNAEKRPSSDDFIAIAQKWQPFRSAAARLLWHFYLSEKRKA